MPLFWISFVQIRLMKLMIPWSYLVFILKCGSSWTSVVLISAGSVRVIASRNANGIVLIGFTVIHLCLVLRIDGNGFTCDNCSFFWMMSLNPFSTMRSVSRQQFGMPNLGGDFRDTYLLKTLLRIQSRVNNLINGIIAGVHHICTTHLTLILASLSHNIKQTVQNFISSWNMHSGYS